MTSLFLDTSSLTFTVALVKDDKILYEKTDGSNNQLAENLLPTINQVLKKCKVDINEIDKIYIVNGPGSFTGIRIGLTFAKVLAWTLKKDLIPISKLEFMATVKQEADFIIPIIDARRGYVYGAIYDSKGNIVFEDKYILLTELLEQASLICKDSKILITSEQLINGVDTEEPLYDIMKLLKRHVNDKVVNIHSCNPNYLKKTEAEENHDKKNNR